MKIKLTKRFASAVLALILTLGVGGFTVFAGGYADDIVEVGIEAMITTPGVDTPDRGGYPIRPPEPIPCLCGVGDGFNPHPVCGNG